MNKTTQPRPETPVSTRVVQSIAESAGVDSFDLEPPLFYTIDLEALDRLVRSGFTGRVRFEYEGYTVTVRSEGAVTVEESRVDDR